MRNYRSIMNYSYLLIILLSITTIIQAADEVEDKKVTLKTLTKLPEYILPCTKGDPEVNNCIRDTFNHLRKYIVKGIPEINLNPIEPMRIDRMAMENGQGAVRVRALFSNMTVLGAGNYSIVSVKSDLNRLRIDLGMRIPRITATGRYEVTGQVLLFPVRSRGEFWATFNDITAVIQLHGKSQSRGGENFLFTERLGVDFHLGGKSRFRIRDVVNGNTVIGEAMNHFLNENAGEIIDEMKPAASYSIGRHFQGFLNQAFLQIPMRLWLLDPSAEQQ